MFLRPHHLLCMQKFSGHGYSLAFTAHMTALLHDLHAHPDTPVTLICRCDTPQHPADRCISFNLCLLRMVPALQADGG